MTRRYFEFSEGTSNKFWEVWVEGNKVLTRYGKIGANGQTTIKDEASPANAKALHDKLVKEKTGKGYLERGGAPAAAAEAPPPAAAKKAAPAPVAAMKQEAVVEPGFRRFEFSEGTSNKFWEVKVEESTQFVRYGKIGTAGQEKEKEFDTPGEAKVDTKKLIAEKTGKGYVEVGVKPKPEGNPQLEAAIEKNLNDPAPYLVYADWLQSQGDPLGELIMLQAQGNEAAATALINKNDEAFLGVLSKFVADKKDPRTEKKNRYSSGERGYFAEWQFGFIKHLDWRWDAFDLHTSDDPNEDLKALLELPTARFLQSLKLGPCPGEEEMNMSPVIDAFEEAKKPSTLRELYLAELSEWDISGTTTGDFGSIHHLFPKLEKLTLRAGQIDLGKNVSLPELKELVVETGGLTKEDIKHICTMTAPKLERLSIWFGDENYGASGSLKDIAAILDGSAFPKLKHLGIMNCSWVGDAAAALPTSKILKQLTSLDLSMGCLSDKDIDGMVANQAAFAHLQHLNVDNNGLTDASKPKVKGLAKDVNWGTEQEPERAGEDAYRYVAVGE
jgi:uncharacterized protein (TIGR02996 family)